MAEQTTGHERGVRKTKQGRVVSRVGDKSIAVRVERRVKHPLYGKTLRRVRRYHVHDEENQAGLGDDVKIVECKPMSRMKRWRLVEVLNKAAASG